MPISIRITGVLSSQSGFFWQNNKSLCAQHHVSCRNKVEVRAWHYQPKNVPRDQMEYACSSPERQLLAGSTSKLQRILKPRRLQKPESTRHPCVDSRCTNANATISVLTWATSITAVAVATWWKMKPTHAEWPTQLSSVPRSAELAPSTTLWTMESSTLV